MANSIINRIGTLIDRAFKPTPRSPDGIVAKNLGLAFYPSDGHYVLFLDGDKDCDLPASNAAAIKQHFADLIDELERRRNA
jgi:hypothetical protein